MFLTGCGETNSKYVSEAKSDIPRYALNSPFAKEYRSPVPEEGKRLWASSCLWEKAPEIVVEQWLDEAPETSDKYVLIEFWATWCSYCKLAVEKLNRFDEKYGERLAIIAITEDDIQKVKSFDAPKMNYSVGIDTKGQMMKKLSAIGFPHIIIIEPSGYVVWEGFPFLDGYELTDEVVEKILYSGGTRQQDL